MDSVPIRGFSVLRGFSGNDGFGAGSPVSSSLVLDEGRGDHGPMGNAQVGKEAPGSRAVMALKSHSEAERRRRERINSHLARLRSMVPCADKLDKAALLAEVISHVKELKSDAVEVSKGCTIPSDVDEVRVEVDGDGWIKASLSCEDRPDLLEDLRQTLQPLQLKTIWAEISATGGRVKHALVFKSTDDSDRNRFVTSVHHALQSVLDRGNEPDFLPRALLSSKRQRISAFESSCSSS